MAARHNKKAKTDEEQIEDSIFQIYQFYSRQHFKRDIEFEKQLEILKIDKGALIAFCRDYNLSLPKQSIQAVFRKISKDGKPMDFEMFKSSLPILALEYAQEKIEETKYRLLELKIVLEYPKNLQ